MREEEGLDQVYPLIRIWHPAQRVAKSIGALAKNSDAVDKSVDEVPRRSIVESAKATIMKGNATDVTLLVRVDDNRMRERALQSHRPDPAAQNFRARPMAQLVLEKVDDELPPTARHD